MKEEGLGKKGTENKSFTKWETYESFKHCRSINSRSDLFKCFSGPIFHSIEQKVFQNDHFMKFVPVKDRPKVMIERLDRWQKYYVSDFTSFESSMTAAVMEAAECQLYRYMLKNEPEKADIICRALTSENKCKFDGYTVTVSATRMSGDMCTSLGNGFTNLMANLFVAEESGVHIDGLVEGDDGVFGYSGEIEEALFAKMGFIIKLDRKDNLYQTSFCGMSLTRQMTSMVEPRKVLLNFGWTHSRLGLASDKYLMGLLRSKALSLVYEHPRCPILTVLGLRVLELTKNVRPVKSDDLYKRRIEEESLKFSDHTLAELNRGIDADMRADFALAYAVSIQDQLELEKWISRMSLGPLDHPIIQSWFWAGSPSRVYWSKYVSYYNEAFDYALADEVRPKCFSYAKISNGLMSGIQGIDPPPGAA